MINFTVYGKPAQMGSKKAFVVGNRSIITDDNSKQRKQWANAVATAAAEAMEGKKLIYGPVHVLCQFYFARPKSHYRTGKHAGELKGSAPDSHGQSPDIDKLVRNAFDSMTGVVFQDDRLVSSLIASRHWTEEQERAYIEVVQVGGES